MARTRRMRIRQTQQFEVWQTVDLDTYEIKEVEVVGIEPGTEIDATVKAVGELDRKVTAKDGTAKIALTGTYAGRGRGDDSGNFRGIEIVKRKAVAAKKLKE